MAAIPSDKKLALYDFEGRSIMELPEGAVVHNETQILFVALRVERTVLLISDFQ